jgi:hypothetical protein
MKQGAKGRKKTNVVNRQSCEIESEISVANSVGGPDTGSGADQG